MNFHGKDIKIFTGSSNVDVAQGIAGCLGLPLGKSDCTQFSDGEISVSLHESVRGSDCFIVQSTCAPVNDNLMEMLIMIDAMKRASAARITVVMPYFGYARQDRKAKARDPISAKLVANLITTAGADRVLTLDLHAPQIQGFFDIPVDNILGGPLFCDYFLKKFSDCLEDTMVVSPDVGSVSRARNFALRMGLNLAIVDKRPRKSQPVRSYEHHRQGSGTSTSFSLTTWSTLRAASRRGKRAHRDRRGEGRLCLRFPRCSLRQRHRAHREQPSERDPLPRLHSVSL